MNNPYYERTKGLSKEQLQHNATSIRKGTTSAVLPVHDPRLCYDFVRCVVEQAHRSSLWP